MQPFDCWICLMQQILPEGLPVHVHVGTDPPGGELAGQGPGPVIDRPAREVHPLAVALDLELHDFRIFLDYLESEGVNKVGVTGISLGGYPSALLASVEERLEFAIPNVPVVSLADLVQPMVSMEESVPR